MEDSKIIDGNRWVAYFDILGFSNMVESFPVWFVREQYKEALKESKVYANCKFKFFSDSFIFYTDDDSQESLRGISTASAHFFQAMFQKKYIPMRGCLNVGQFYTDEEESIFFGRALIEAHQLAEGQNWIGFVLSKTSFNR